MFLAIQTHKFQGATIVFRGHLQWWWGKLPQITKSIGNLFSSNVPVGKLYPEAFGSFNQESTLFSLYFTNDPPRNFVFSSCVSRDRYKACLDSNISFGMRFSYRHVTFPPRRKNTSWTLGHSIPSKGMPFFVASSLSFRSLIHLWWGLGLSDPPLVKGRSSALIPNDDKLYCHSRGDPLWTPHLDRIILGTIIRAIRINNASKIEELFKHTW